MPKQSYPPSEARRAALTLWRCARRQLSAVMPEDLHTAPWRAFARALAPRTRRTTSTQPDRRWQRTSAYPGSSATIFCPAR